MSMLKKYHIALLFTTLFVFVSYYNWCDTALILTSSCCQITSSTYSLLQDLTDSPAKVLDKVAATLPGAKDFFVSYVMLSGKDTQSRLTCKG